MLTNPTPHHRERSSIGLWNSLGGKPRSQIRSDERRSTMFDAPITIALFAAFLLGIVAGSGLEILVRSGRY
jgi:hypothetical protein